MSTTTGTFPGIRIMDMPDLGAVSDTSSVVGERAGSGRFSVQALTAYATKGVIPFIASIAALRALSSGIPVVYVQGYYTSGDGGGGAYMLGAPGADNGGSIIVSPAGTYYLQTYGAPVSVKQFGARGDNATDDAAAINAAFSAGTSIAFPAGNYLASNSLYITRDGTHIIGAGRNATRIVSNSSTAQVISLATNVMSVVIEHLTLDRNLTATNGADGISAPGYVQFCRLSNLIVQNQWKGLHLGPTGYSYIDNVVSMLNLDDGFYWTNTASNGGLQWSLNNCLSSQNGGHGFSIFAAPGPTAINLGEIVNCSTYANVGTGFAAVGLPDCPIEGVRLTEGFFGSDNNDEIYLDTYGGDHKIIGVYTELAGTSSAGPTLSTPPTHVGAGFFFTPNNTDVACSNCHAEGHSNSGFNTSSREVQFNACIAINNGASTTADRAGFFQISGRVSFFSVRAGNTQGSNLQQHGIYLTDATGGALIWGADLTGNSTATLTVTAGGTNNLTMGGVVPAGSILLPNGGIDVGNAVGGVVVGGINVSTDVYKNNTAYTNP
jgi:hypothetical protein